MIEQSTINNVKTMDMRIILADAGVNFNDRGKYQCPDPNHEDKNYSASILKGKDGSLLLHCFGDNKTWDNISLYGTLHNLDPKRDFPKIVKELCDLSGQEMKYQKVVKTHVGIDEKFTEEQKERFMKRVLDNSKNFDDIRKQFNSKSYLDIYFHKRCLSYSKLKPILQASGIEIKHNAYKDKKTGKYRNSIIYHIKQNESEFNKEYNIERKNFCIQKNIDKYLGKGNNDYKGNIGSPSPSYFKSGDIVNDIYVCEGIEDAMSLLMVKNDCIVVSLNSTSNVEQFKEDLDKFYMGEVITICLDNDETGIKNSKALEYYLIKEYDLEKGYNLYTYEFKDSKCKDINDLWVKYSKENKNNTRKIELEKQKNYNDKIILEAISKDFNNIKYMSKKQSNDKAFIMEAITNNYYNKGKAYYFASKELKKDYEIIEATLKMDGRNYINIPNEFKDNINLIKIAVNEYPKLIEKLTPELKNNEKIAKIAVNREVDTYLYLSDKLKENPEIALLAIKQKPILIKEVSNKLKVNSDFIIKAIEIQKEKENKLIIYNNVSNSVKENQDIKKLLSNNKKKSIELSL